MGKFVKTTFHEKENRASVILREFTHTCVELSRLLQKKNTGIMLYLLMTILIDDGSSSCIRRVKLSQSFVGSRHWWRRSQGSK